MYTLRILILEDDTLALSALTKAIAKLEAENIDQFDVALTILAEYTQVEEYINNTKMEFDIVLLDRDCKSCGSFHALDFEKIGVAKIISISAIPEWNKEAKKKGVQKVKRNGGMKALRQFHSGCCSNTRIIWSRV